MRRLAFNRSLSGVLACVGLSAVVTTVACVDTSRRNSDDGAATGGGDGVGGENGGDDSGTNPQAPAEFDCGQLEDRSEPIVLGYVPTWSRFDETVQGLDYDALTHVAVAFANPIGPNESVIVGDVEDAQVATLIEKAHENGVKVLISIAGASHSEEVRAQLEADKVDAFVASIDALVDKHGFDGVDVDVEGGSVDSTYEPFVTKLAAVVRPKGKVVTSAVGAWFANAISDRAMWCFDFINIMSYDYAGSWSEPGDHASYANAEKDVEYWTTQRGYSRERAVLGVPFYGRGWGDKCALKYASFDAIAAAYPDKTTQDWIAQGECQISFNGTTTMRKKGALGSEYGGVMIWEVTQDTADAALMTALMDGVTAGPAEE